MRRHLELQMHMVRPDMPLEDFDIVRAADFADQIAHLDRDVASKDRLAILRAEHEVVVQLIHGITRYGRLGDTFPCEQRIASLLKASPKGEGFHPSQIETVRF